MHLKEGTLLKNGTYRIVRFINSGGFGCTYEAVHTTLEDRFAIKEFFVKDFCNRDEDSRHVSVGTQSKKALVEKLKKKFVKEARSIRQLKHNGIVRVSDVFEENGTAYYVMDYIEGESLGQVVKDRVRLCEEEASAYIRQVASTLDFVHSKNILHLDIKPDNIMLDSSGSAILIDFGISKQYDEEEGENTSTLMGKTPGYAPLEQMDNEVQEFTPATDIYSLGATFYKLLTGITPPNSIKRATGAKMDPLPSGISEPCRDAIESAMRLRKEDRPQSVGEFLAILESKTSPKKEDTYVEMEVDPVPEPDPTPTPVPNPNPRGKWIILLILSVILGFGGYYAYEVIEGKKYEAMLIDKHEYLSLIGEGDSLLGWRKKYSESINKYKQAQVYEEKYSSTVYSGEFDEGASAKIRAAEETERLEKERQQPGTAEYNRTHGRANGYGWVDLGLSVKWATCNVGAERPEDYGNYYAWGETSTKSAYGSGNSKTYGKQMNDIDGRSQYDAARANWGGSWRLPTKAECQELADKCTWTWTTQNGVKGCKVTGPNGNSIFLPAAGLLHGSSNFIAGEHGEYWTSTPYESNSDCAYTLNFISRSQGVHRNHRYYGRTVRPVSE